MGTRGKIEPGIASMIGELAAGDSEAWSLFVARYGKLIYGAIHRTSARFGAAWDELDVEELFEEALVKLLRDRAKALRAWEGRCKLETWIYRIVRNVCIDRLRKEARRSGDSELLEESCPPGGQVSERSAADLRLSLEQAIERALLPKEAIAIRLIYFEGFTYREVGERLGMTVGAVSGFVYRALGKLRREGGLSCP